MSNEICTLVHSTPSEEFELIDKPQLTKPVTRVKLDESYFRFELADVTVIVKIDDKVVYGKVSSHIMVIISPVFKKSLCKQIRSISEAPKEEGEKKPETKAMVLKFIHDDPEAVSIVLNIAHHRLKSVPYVELPYETLLNVASFCNTYECLELVSLHLKKWIGDEDTEGFESLINGHENWLFIAWVFGRKKIFGSLAEKLVNESKIDSCGNGLTPGGQKFQQPMPESIIENIISIREVVIQSLLDTWYSYVNDFSGTIRCNYGIESCDSIAFGSISLGLRKLGLLPEKRANEVGMSVKELADKLLGIDVNVLPTSKGKNHLRCHKVDIELRINGVLNTIPSPVLDIHHLHMEEARVALGIERANEEDGDLDDMCR